MNGLELQKHAIMTRKLMEEYEELIDTVEPITNGFVPIIPSCWDMVFLFHPMPVEEAIFEVIELAHNNRIFIKHDNNFIFVPIKEVW